MTNNPIEIFYCWQAVVTAIMVYMLTQFVKAVLPYVYTPKTEKQKIFIKRVLLVAIPPFLGFIAGALIPIHPEVLIEYVTSNNMSKYQAMLIYGGWGAAVGQFADYGYSKVKKLLGDVNTNRQSQTPPEE